jgi:hypothetical protein
MTVSPCLGVFRKGRQVACHSVCCLIISGSCLSVLYGDSVHNTVVARWPPWSTSTTGTGRRPWRPSSTPRWIGSSIPKREPRKFNPLLRTKTNKVLENWVNCYLKRIGHGLGAAAPMIKDLKAGKYTCRSTGEHILVSVVLQTCEGKPGPKADLIW